MPRHSSTMTAVVITKPGGPDVLAPRDVPTPEPAAGQLLVKVAAAGVNRPDVMQRQGLYPAPPGHSPVPGLEAAGEVVATGPGTARFKAGDQVTALLNGGGYAQYCLVEEGSALPIPKGLSLTEAAGLPETVFTVWHNVFERGRLQAGETILVHGGTSGIGTIAVMLAKAKGARVIATAGSPDKCKACERLGADRAVDYRKEDYVEAVKDVTAGKGADLILDMVGGDYIGRNITAAAEDGRIVQIAFLKGSKVELDAGRLMMKRLTYTGSTLRIRSNAFKTALARAVEQNVWPLIQASQVKPVIDSTFPLARAAEAHSRMEGGAHIGKIMLEV